MIKKNIIRKPASILLGYVVAFILLSCNQSPKVENTNKGSIMDAVITMNDTLQDDNKLLHKDTLFSVFTSDMTWDEGSRKLEQLAREKGNNFVFKREEDSYSSSFVKHFFSLPDHNAIRYVPYYEMVFDGVSYIFDIIFNGYGGNFAPSFIAKYGKVRSHFRRDDEPTKYFDGSTYIDFMTLYHESENETLIENVINLYSRVYGAYNKTTKHIEAHCFIKTLRARISTDNIPYNRIHQIDIYTWETRPRLKIIHRKTHLIDEMPNYSFTTNIIYHSKRFLNNLKIYEEKEAKRIWDKEEEMKQKESSVIDDI